MIGLMLLLGAGLGAGLWAAAVWLVPPRPPLRSLITRLNTTPAPPPILVTGNDGWAVALGRPLVRGLSALGLPRQGIAQDLTITGRSLQTHLAEKAALLVTGLVLPAALAVVVSIGGHPAPWPLPALGSLLLALVGFLVPDVVTRSEAGRRRTTFRHALSAYLDLIDILLAGGSGVDEALDHAVHIGRGWSFDQLRRAVTTARLARTTPWTTLGQLGEELDVTELAELAAALALAGTEGAKVRASLTVKAEALRAKAGAEAEATANSATERMTVPAALLAFAFVIFVFYPAMTQITAAL